jgi:hypothetical protein
MNGTISITALLRRFGPLLIMSALIFLASAQEKAPMPDLGFSWQDKVFHAAAYAVYAWCIAHAASGGTGIRQIGERQALLWMIAGTALYAAGDELHQAFVPGRSCDVGDWIADIAGAMVTIAGVWWRGRQQRKTKVV